MDLHRGAWRVRLSAVLLARGRVAMAYPVPSLQHVVLPRKHFLGQVVFAPSPLSACLTQCTATQVGLAIGEIINAAVLERGSALVGFTGSPSLESLVSQFALHVSTTRAKTYCACARAIASTLRWGSTRRWPGTKCA